MTILLNKQPLTLPEGATVADALKAAKLAPEGKATALNGVVVPATMRQAKQLNEGDSLLVISAFYGG